MDDGAGSVEDTTGLEIERNPFDDTDFEAEDECGTFSEDSIDELFEDYEEDPNNPGNDLNNYDTPTGFGHTASADVLSSEVEFPIFASPNTGYFNTSFASCDRNSPGESFYGNFSSEEGHYNPIKPPPNTLETPKTLKRPAPEVIPQWTPSPSKYASANRSKRQRVTTNNENDLEILNAFNSTDIRNEDSDMKGDTKSVKIGDDYLHKLPKEEVFKQLVDCFRIDVDNKFSEQIDKSERLSMPGISLAFEDMLGKAACRYGFMPSWWDHRAYEKCVEVARDRRRCECSVVPFAMAHFVDND